MHHRPAAVHIRQPDWLGKRKTSMEKNLIDNIPQR